MGRMEQRTKTNMLFESLRDSLKLFSEDLAVRVVYGTEVIDLHFYAVPQTSSLWRS